MKTICLFLLACTALFITSCATQPVEPAVPIVLPSAQLTTVNSVTGSTGGTPMHGIRGSDDRGNN